MLDALHIIAFTHRNCHLDEIGLLHLEEESRGDALDNVRQALGMQEIMYLSTCNRVEIVLAGTSVLPNDAAERLLGVLRPDKTKAFHHQLAARASVYNGVDAARHFLMVAASLDSLVVGEREIITQVRDAFEKSRTAGLTGDVIRLLVKKAVEAAKEVFTATQIAHRPVSVVSLAYRMLREQAVNLDAKIIIVGAGQTNTAMARYLRKHGFRNFTVFNRTFSRGRQLADEIGGTAFPLEELTAYQQGFDVIITCTGSSNEIITPAIYSNLLNGDEHSKIVIDLAIPFDFNREIMNNHPVKLIGISSLREIADQNLQQRQGELEACNKIIDLHLAELEGLFRQRSVEVAMKEVPVKIREIRETALQAVFARDIENLDDQSKQVLEKVVDYMEKKYISVPMKMAREILIGTGRK